MHIIKTVKVSEKGQIAIPKTIRKAAKIYQGDELVIVHAAGTLLLGKAEDISTRLADDFKYLLRTNESSREGGSNEQPEPDHHRLWKGRLNKHSAVSLK